MPILPQDKEYLDNKYPNPGFSSETGLSNDEITAHVKTMFAEHKNMPHLELKTRIVEFILDNVRIDVSPHDWFIGCDAWLRKDFEKNIMHHWHIAVLKREYSPEQLAMRKSLSENHIITLCLDYAHSVPDWEAIIRLGFTGMRQRLAYYAQKAINPSEETRQRYAALDRALAAALRFMNRLCQFAEQHADGSRRSQLTLECLRHLRDGHATNTYEVLQQIWIYHLVSESIDCLQTRSLSNLDRILWPFYQHDLERGTFTEADVREMLAYFMYQQSLIKYFWGHPFYLGGTDECGNSIINDLSFMIIDEYDKMGIYDPKLQIKVASNTPPAFLDHVLTMIRGGNTSIVFVGEPCIERSMKLHGYTTEEARTAVIKGCYEYTSNGNAVETAPIRLNTADIVTLVLGNGVDLHSGFDTGIRTGDLATFTTFEQFLNACQSMIRQLGDLACQFADLYEPYLDEINPILFFPAASATALESGKADYTFGSKYNHSNLWLQYPACAIDAIVAVKHVVYDKPVATLEQLRDALKADWNGYESLRETILHDKAKYGNNLPEVDDIAKRFLETFARHIDGRPNSRGGKYNVALHAAHDFTIHREHVGATADGRKRGDELSKNASPCAGRNWAGATAAILSNCKMDSALFASDYPLDLVLHPSTVQGDEGLAIFRSLIMTYIQGYGHAIHFNIFDANLLRDAQKHPEKYQDLQVRICGWNVLWNSLTRHEQDAYIIQAEAN